MKLSTFIELRIDKSLGDTNDIRDILIENNTIKNKLISDFQNQFTLYSRKKGDYVFLSLVNNLDLFYYFNYPKITESLRDEYDSIN